VADHREAAGPRCPSGTMNSTLRKRRIRWSLTKWKYARPPKRWRIASCKSSRLGYVSFDHLSRYETAIWRQAAQIMFMLQSAGPAKP